MKTGTIARNTFPRNKYERVATTLGHLASLWVDLVEAVAAGKLSAAEASRMFSQSEAALRITG